MAQIIEDYRDFLIHSKHASENTVASYMRDIHQYESYLLQIGVPVLDAFAVNEKQCDSNPVFNIKVEKAEKKLPQILTGKEVELLLDQPKCTDLKGFRDKAMLELLYATGIRVSELINLDLTDVNLPGGFIKCDSAGKVRIIPLYPAAIKALTDYIEEVRPNDIMSYADLEWSMFPVNGCPVRVSGK